MSKLADMNAKERKNAPVYSGFIRYFPDAIVEVAMLSRIGNEQHNPGKPLHWDRSKSGDEKDALARHLIDATDTEGNPVYDTDNVLHATKVAWRAMANLQKILEDQKRVNAFYVQATTFPDTPFKHIEERIDDWYDERGNRGDK